MEQQTGCQDLCLRGATDWVSGYCVSGAIDCVSLCLSQTGCQYPDTQSVAPLRQWSNILTPGCQDISLEQQTCSTQTGCHIISWHPVCCSTQTAILGVRILCLSGATDWVSGYYVWVEQQTGCKDIMSEWSDRLGVRILCLLLHSDIISWHPVSVAPLRTLCNILTPRILCLSGATDWVSGYCAGATDQDTQWTQYPDIVSEWSNRLGVSLLLEPDWVSGYNIQVEQQTGCQDILSEWSNRVGVRILFLSGAIDRVSGYYVWNQTVCLRQTGCQYPDTDWVSVWSNRLAPLSGDTGCQEYPDTQSVAPLRLGVRNILTPSLSDWSNRLGVRILCLSGQQTGCQDTISWHPVCCSTQTQYPDTQSVAPLRLGVNILTPSLLLWVSGYCVWVSNRLGVRILCQTLGVRILYLNILTQTRIYVSEWSNRLGVRILCLSGAIDYCVWMEQQSVILYYVWVEQQTGCQDICSTQTDWVSISWHWVSSLLLHSDSGAISWHPVCCSTQT